MLTRKVSTHAIVHEIVAREQRSWVSIIMNDRGSLANDDQS
jgi:hypothetical protein